MTITVAQLIDELSQFDPNLLVVMSKDSEGNGYSPYSDAALGWYSPESTWSGEFSTELLDWDDNLREPYDDEQQALALWPVN